MRVLVITNNPDRASFRQRIELYLGALGRKGIEVHVEKFPPGFFARVKLLRTAADFDAVLLHKKRLNPIDASLLCRYAKKIIYDFDDAVMYSDRKPEKSDGKRRRDFKRTVRIASLVIAGNDYLAKLARKLNPNVAILPTGLDTSAYGISVDKPNDGKVRLVWVGSKSTLPYLVQIKPALEEIGSRFNNVILRIICDDFFELQNMSVEKCYWSLQNQIPNLLTGDIGLAPLPDNRFTRGKCGFKILQYAAAGLPAVASPVGVNAEYVRDGVTGFHSLSTSQWVSKISELIENDDLRKQMGEAARARIQSFDIGIVGKRLVGLIKEIFEKP